MRRLTWLIPAVAVVAFEVVASVHISDPQIAVATPAAIAAMTEGKTRSGCTTFREVALVCDCEPVDRGWRLAAAAKAVPYVYLSSFQYLRHERLHIGDFKEYLGEHVKALGATLFETREACDMRAAAATAAFPETMKKITRLSAARRDNFNDYSSEDHLVVVQAEVMPKLVNDRVADLADRIPAAGRDSKNRTAKNGDLVRKDGQHVKASLSQGDAAINAKELVVVRTVAKRFEVFVSRFFLDNDDNIVEQPGKLVREFFQSFLDEVLELKTS